MFKTVVAIWIYVSSLAAIAASSTVLHYALVAFPAEHLASYGPHIPAFSKASSKSASSQPRVLWGVAVASVAAVAWFWRKASSKDTRNFAVATVSALNFAASAFGLLNLFVAMFLLPRLANGALQ